MHLSSIGSIADIRRRDAQIDQRPSGDREVEINTSTVKGKRFTPMPKQEISLAYHTQMSDFKNKLFEDQTRAASSDKDMIAVQVVEETGRRYDKIMLLFVHKHKKPNTEVRYFVERATGKIFGAKSALAPNEKWYFGNIANATKWDWSGHHGEPVTDDSVAAVSAYGGYKHYVDASEVPAIEQMQKVG